MMSFLDAPVWLAGIMGIWNLVIFVLCLGIVGFDLRRHSIRFSWIMPISFVLYLSLQCIIDIDEMDFALATANPIEAFFAQLPIILPAGVFIVVTVWEIHTIVKQVKWKQTNIMESSIKTAMDSIPAGICCYEDNGHIILKNHAMESICKQFTGEDLLNGKSFVQKLGDKTIYIEERPILVGKEQVFSLEENSKDSKGRNLIIFTAFDVTEKYQRLQELSEKRKEVINLNEKLQKHNQEITSIITQKEILQAKIRIHDVMGSELLSAKRYITGNPSEKLKEEIIEELTRGVDYLLSESSEKAKDEYTRIFETAEKLDVRIMIIGNLPDGPIHKHIFSTAIHECITNTLRHAGGDSVYVTVEETGDTVRLIITNNGTKPSAPIKERGGLASLRTITEANEGTMVISVSGGFRLEIALPREVKNNGI